MSFQEELKKARRLGSNLGLKRIKLLLKGIGSPEKKLNIIHIAGTNGKGSTSTYLYNILLQANYKVGLFTSPFVYEFEERIQKNGVKVKQTDLKKSFVEIESKLSEIKKKIGESPTEFEILTAVALNYFSKENLDFVILEVGLGGRLDSTNISKTPLLTAITSISKDHTKELGNTVKKIAKEKAGIIKKNVPILSNVLDEDAKKVIAKIAYKKNAPLIDVTNKPISIKFINEVVSLPYYQERNIRLVLMIINELIRLKKISIDREIILNGIKNTNLLGRFEIINKKKITYVLDGSHNEDGMLLLKKTIEKKFKDKKIITIFSILEDKNIKKVVEVVEGFSDKVILTKANNERAVSVKELKTYFKTMPITTKTKKEALEEAKKSYKNDSIILITGSFYLLKPIKEML